tara:strand:+ start:141 stop:254 length:114 start_codon:yes stop_codon:yes gene_type:complete
MPTGLENMVEALHAQVQCLKERVLILEQREIHREENK